LRLRVFASGARTAAIERDNQGGRDARIKKVYVFSIAGLTPQPQGGVFPGVIKYQALDLLPQLQSFNGWVLDKPEELAVAKVWKGLCRDRQRRRRRGER